MCSKGAHHSSIRGRADEGRLAIVTGRITLWRTELVPVSLWITEEGLAGPW